MLVLSHSFAKVLSNITYYNACGDLFAILILQAFINFCFLLLNNFPVGFFDNLKAYLIVADSTPQPYMRSLNIKVKSSKQFYDSSTEESKAIY